MAKRRPIVLCLGFLLAGLSLSAQERDDSPPQDLKKLSIEELAQVNVTSVSRRSEPLNRTAAAVAVIRQQDIARSGTTTLAEALRLGDAVDVAQVNGNTWGISTRGFNISTANKLLVLIDGRSTYVPLFGGTFWDVQDALLADIDRIEVIRGPGGTIWGANAVNGVVNVISRSAAETQGTAITLLGGTNDRAVASARYGGKLGDGFFRVYGKFRHRGAQLLAAGGSAQDEVGLGQAGFRYDSPADAKNRWFVSGLAYRGSIGLRVAEDGDTSGGHILARFNRRTPRGGEFQLQGYYDRSSRTIPMQFRGTRDTYELDAQQSARAGAHSLLVGSTIRMSDASDVGIAGFLFDPAERLAWTFNAFVQDEWMIRPDRVYFTAGAKAGRNNYTGFEFQPNVRLRIHGARQMAWGAVSHAVRLPTRFDTDLRFVSPANPSLILLSGREEFGTESVTAYEAGYRVQPHRQLALDAAVFTNRYDDLRSQESRTSPPFILLGNSLNARTSGIEIAGTAQAAPSWRLHGSYAWLRKSLTLDAGSTDRTGGRDEGNDPSHQFKLQSLIDLPRGLSFDAFFRHVSRRPAPAIPAYSELDFRLGWAVRQGWELSLIGQNVLDDAHRELNSGGPLQEFRRAFMARSAWRF